MSTFEDIRKSQKKIRDAAQEILAVSVKLHLTQREFEQAVEHMKEIAYITIGDES